MRIVFVNTVDVSADHTWSLIAEQFGDAADWSSSMSSSHLDRDRLEVGASRIGTVGKRQLIEKVTKLDRENRTFGYELIDPPAVLQAAANLWRITPLGDDRSEITSELNLSLHWLAKPLSPLIGFGLKRQMASAFEEFCCYAETGTPHQRKLDKQG